MLKVSDHAIFRFIQRTLKWRTTLERDIQERIVESSGMALSEIEKGRFPIGEGTHAVVKDGTVVTIVYSNHKEQERDEYDYVSQGIEYTSKGE